ncbi:MAG: tetratricopeptide repeat protein [Bacteroidales bacterium]|jgi:tetratricopeptide (TPR) repeat protein|nr:tetratricopeptide repeat protein [Bacteroidales bacterium]
MKEEFEDIFQNDEYDELLNRWEDMLKNKKKYFFDVFEFENIIDYYIDTDKANNALKAITLAAEQHPTSIIIQLKKAQVFIDKGQSAQALKIIEQLELIESSNVDVYLVKGAALNALNRYSEAERAFDLAISLSFDEKAEVIQSVANAFEQIGKYQVSLKYLLEAYKLDPTNLLILFDIGYCYEKLGQIKKSIDYYLRYLDREPFSENAWYNLGILYTKAEMFDKAVEAYEFALAINPEFSLAYFNLANAYSNNEDFLKAIENYQEYLNYDGNSVEVLSYMGDCYESLKDYDHAFEYYDSAIKEDEFFADAYFGKANILYQQNKYNESLEFVNKALSIDDLNAEYHYLLGSIFSDLKDYDSASKSYKKAFEIDATESDFVLALNESLVKINKFIEAKDILIGFLKENRKNASVFYRLAGCFLLLKDKNQAIDAFENGLRIDPTDHNEVLTIYPDAFIKNEEFLMLIESYLLKDLN